MSDSDISLDELEDTINFKVNYKRLPFRTANRSCATVELAPGVCTTVNINSVLAGGRTTAVVPPAVQPSFELGIPVEEGTSSEFRDFLTDLKGLVERHLASKKSDAPADEGTRFRKKPARVRR
jgi:hypothetical protein